MAVKSKHFKDKYSLVQILAAPDPQSAKALRRRGSGFDDEAWKTNARLLRPWVEYVFTRPHVFTVDQPRGTLVTIKY